MLTTTSALTLAKANHKKGSSGVVYVTPLIQNAEAQPVFPDISPGISDFGNSTRFVSEALYNPLTYQHSVSNALVHADQLAYLLPCLWGFGTTAAEGTGSYRTTWTSIGAPISCCIDETYGETSTKGALFELGYLENLTFAVSQVNEELKWSYTWKGHLMTPGTTHPTITTKDNTDNIMFGNQTGKVTTFAITPEGGSSIDLSDYLTDFSATINRAITPASKASLTDHPILSQMPNYNPISKVSVTYNGIEANPSDPALALQALYLGSTSTSMPGSIDIPKKCAVHIQLLGGAATDPTKKYTLDLTMDAFHYGKQMPNGDISGNLEFSALTSLYIIHDVAGASIARPT